MIELFLYSLILTIIIETGTLIILRELLFFKLYKIKFSKIIFTGILASFATLPYLWFILYYFLWYNYILFTIIWESSVVIIESIIFYFIFEIKYYKAFLVSFIVNLISYLIWLIII